MVEQRHRDLGQRHVFHMYVHIYTRPSARTHTGTLTLSHAHVQAERQEQIRIEQERLDLIEQKKQQAHQAAAEKVWL